MHCDIPIAFNVSSFLEIFAPQQQQQKLCANCAKGSFGAKLAIF
jgi:hypothetical protein